MPNPATRLIAPPPLAFRVGVTGAAGLDEAAKERLRPRIAAVLGRVKAGLDALAVDTRAVAVYEPGADGTVRPKLRMVSPLGAGADRLVAAEALRLGYALEVPLPFAQADYEATFPDSVPEFRALLAEAGPRVLTLDGDAADPVLRARSYGEVGRLVARNCDLLIAIWDDRKLPKGRGGTSDTVRFAVHTSVPVWWLHADGAHEPRLLTESLHLEQPEDAPSGDKAVEALDTRLRDTILPPVPPQPVPGGMFDRIARWLRRRLGVERDPLRVFLGEVSRENWRLWKAHDWILGPPRRGAAKSLPPDPPSDPADQLSLLYQARYRSSYVFVFVLAAVALVAAVLDLAVRPGGEMFEHLEIIFTAQLKKQPSLFEAGPAAVELAALLLILGLVLWNKMQRWQDRYMSYRLVAELFRMQRRLAVLGWSLPGIDVAGLAARSGRGWVAWYFAAVVRATTLPEGVLATRLPDMQQGAERDLLDDQIRFHERRLAWKERRGENLELWGEWLFFITLAFVFVEATLVILELAHVAPVMSHRTAPWFGLAAALLPAASAAFFGVRAYEEMEVLAVQSEQMLAVLRAVKARIGAIRLDRPLASRLLGAELFEVAGVMLADVNGWAQLFRAKSVGA